MKNKNLPLGLKYGETYDSKVVNKCGNHVYEGFHYKLESIDIRRLDEMIKYNHSHWSPAFVSLRSKELTKEAGRAYHSNWRCVARYMEDYEVARPVPPIVINGTKIDDGNHRLYAQYKLGYNEIDAFVKLS